MSISDQLESLRIALDVWAKPKGGQASVVSNLRDMWEQAKMDSQVPRVLICYMGEKMRGPFGSMAVWGRADQSFAVAVTRGRGFTSNRGETLTQQVGNVDPFLDDLEEAKNVIRNMTGITMEYPVDYKGNKAMQLGNLVVDGYLIEFSTANDLEPLTVKGT